MEREDVRELPIAWWVSSALFVLALGIGAWSARAYRSNNKTRCQNDGLPLQSEFVVTVTDVENGVHRFCSITCTERWIGFQRKGWVARVELTDEATGRQIPLKQAIFVESLVKTNQLNGDRRHVFGSAGAAKRHAERYSGRILDPTSTYFPRFHLGND